MGRSSLVGLVTYRARNKGVQILLSNSLARPGRTVKQEQEEISRNHIQAFIPDSVQRERSSMSSLNERGGPNGWGGRLDKKQFSDIACDSSPGQEANTCLNLTLLVKTHVCKPKLPSSSEPWGEEEDVHVDMSDI